MTTTSLAKLERELRPHHNEICLVHDFEPARLIGVGRDDHDLYYIVQDRKRGVVWATAVGHIQPLKALLPEDTYNRLENTHSLNGCPQTMTFMVDDRAIWDEGLSVRHRLVSKCGRFLLILDHDRPDDRFALWRVYPETPGAADALILRGEIAVLEDLARRMIAEMADWEAQRQAG